MGGEGGKDREGRVHGGEGVADGEGGEPSVRAPRPPKPPQARAGIDRRGTGHCAESGAACRDLERRQADGALAAALRPQRRLGSGELVPRQPLLVRVGVRVRVRVRVGVGLGWGSG